ncbi:uncharacterized protein LOC131845448 [Achroia grisella]|uniref:uncharacterized protein LOC131845448 n=1 Tax=Achroia grisella TaxID=688607 RepID=UPI0027D26C6B|nr:uncharacterized protein LOC131845448 [Achroia grisella]
MYPKITSLILTLICTLQIVKSSVVIDSLSQKGIHITDYCPKMKYCEEGAHVMCMYYNPNKIMGPRCSRPKNVSITPELANKLLEVSNAVRSKIALGKEKGKDGDYLPRGYGIFRLQWDNELATFAQVLANQCVLRHDMCRATKRFSDPGQTAGLVRFSYPDWYPVSKAGHFTKPGLSPSKLLYAITQALKSWYGQKVAVTPNMITSYPDWALKPNKQGGRLYLEMIYGPATHMGCGISAYTEYAFYDNNAALNYNSVQIICNYSARPRKGGSVYNTTVPIASGFTGRCGCPRGSVEDGDCLCYDKPQKDISPRKLMTCSDDDMNCNPSVVLLPIFTMEDAPSQKLINSQENEGSTTIRENSMDIFDFEETAFPNVSTKKPHIENILNEIINSPLPKLTMPSRPLKRMADVKNRHFSKKSIIPDHQYLRKQSPQLFSSHAPNKKSSIFSRTTIFELPRLKEEPQLKVSKDFKKDVAPRKDFTKVRNLVKIYMKDRKHKTEINHDGSVANEQNIRHSKPDFHEPILRIPVTTISFMNTAEEKVMHDYQYKIKNATSGDSTDQFNMISSNEDSDKKLITLLDKLEQEVKHVQWHGEKKDMFDAKIRKIYDNIIRNPINLMSKDDVFLELGTLGNQTSNNLFHSNVSHDRETMLEHNIDNDINKNFEEINSRYLKTNLKTYKTLNEVNHNMRPITSTLNHISLPLHKKIDVEYENLRKGYDYDITKQQPFADIPRDNHQSYNGVEEVNRNKYKDIYATRNIYNRNIAKQFYDHEISRNQNHKEYDDLLGPERIQYYQDKLDNLERKLQYTRKLKHQNLYSDTAQHVRRIRPTTHDTNTIHSRRRTLVEPLYVPDRARFLHGF